MVNRRGRAFALGVAAPALLWSFMAVGAGTVAEPAEYWTGDANAPVPAAIHGGTVIHVKALEALLKKPGTVLVDVSTAPRKPSDLAPGAPWMPLPHRALPDALWIPGAGAGTMPQEVDDYYRSRLGRATAGKIDAPLVVYCHNQCWLSWNAAKRAIGYGYRQVYWFSEGVEGWSAAGQPTTVAEPQGPDASSLTASAAPSTGAPSTGAPPLPDTAHLPKLAVLDIELSGDLGGPEFAAEHDARLKTESARLRQDLERTGLYDIVDNGPAQSAIDHLKSQQAYLHDCNGCDLDIGRQLHADFVFVAWVDRVSGLILTLTYEVHEVKSGQITSRKSFDFRGDNDSAWNHAIDYMVRDLKAASGAPSNSG